MDQGCGWYECEVAVGGRRRLVEGVADRVCLLLLSLFAGEVVSGRCADGLGAEVVLA